MNHEIKLVIKEHEDALPQQQQPLMNGDQRNSTMDKLEKMGPTDASPQPLMNDHHQRNGNLNDNDASPGRPNILQRFIAAAWIFLRTHYKILLGLLALVLFLLGMGVMAAMYASDQTPPSKTCNLTVNMKQWKGGLHQNSNITAFVKGMKEQNQDNITQLKEKFLLVGPFHKVQPNQLNTLELQSIDPNLGKMEDVTFVLKNAHKKGGIVVLDLTPNYREGAPWFGTITNEVMEKLIAAVEFWLRLGVDGIKLSGFTVPLKSSLWSKLLTTIHHNQTKNSTDRVLIGMVKGLSATDVSLFAKKISVDLLLSDLHSSNNKGTEIVLISAPMERIEALDVLSSQQTREGAGLSTHRDQLSKVAKTPALIRLYLLLLFTMLGIPEFTCGDEVGLQAGQAESKEDVEKWFISLSKLRGKEPSLLHGRYYPLSSSSSSSSSLAFLRVWDQSERFITVVNWGMTNETLTLTLAPTEGIDLPESAMVKLSTDGNLAVDSSVRLDKITLAPGTAVLLHFS